MALLEMRKVHIIGDKDLGESVVKKLGELALFQPGETKEETFTSSLKKENLETKYLEDNLSRLSWTIDYLKEFDEKKAGLGLFPSKTIIKEEEFLGWIKGFDWKKVCKSSQKLKEELETLKEEKETLQETYHFLYPWRELSFSCQRFQERKFVAYQWGTIPLETKDTLQKELEKEKGTYLDIIKEEEGTAYFLLIFLKECQARIESILQRLKVEKIEFKEEGSPKEKLKKIEQRTSQLEKRADEIEKEFQRTSREKIKLMAAYDYFYHLLQEKKVAAQTRSTPYTFLIGGWIKKVDLAKLKKGLKDLSPLEIVVREPAKKEEEKVPVALSNRGFFKPFELVIDIYGLPRYFEIDPTPFLAPFFALFLAICLTDGGYGIILSILAYLALKKLKGGETARKLFSMLFITGFVTFGIGIITGGIFGIEFSRLPPFLAPLKQLALLNPVRQPMIFLLVCLTLGIVHILVGIGLELWEDLRRKDIVSAILDHASWILLILGGILILSPTVKGMFLGAGQSGASEMGLAGSNTPISLSPGNIKNIWGALPAYSKLGLIMSLWGVGTLFLFVGRKSKSLFIRFAKGGYELYGIVQVFADVLSYSRLLALGLATSVIAMVVNTIASMMGKTPFIGPVLMVIILIGGHLGNLVLNCLSGFIHTARLQFVEFFGKFYEGGGESFKPFRREGKYTVIEGEKIARI